MQGSLNKMRGHLDEVVHYTLRLGGARSGGAAGPSEADLDLNACLGAPLTLEFNGRIVCDACGRTTPKSYAQGHCYPCMRRLARCDLCVLKPETCHYAAGTCREPAWGERHCMVPHVVYLANTSGLKVGITRASQVPTRWVDQGASQALPIAEVATRHVAGLVEVAIARSMADRTDWRAMLRGPGEALDLHAAAVDALAAIAGDIDAIRATHGVDAVRPLDAEVLDIAYPVTRYPERITALNLDRQPRITGTLEGIKGQYLLLDRGVLNVRKFTGYEVTLHAPA